MARQPPTPVPEATPLCSECLLDLNARQRGVDANAKSAGNAERLQLSATSPHHREVVSGGSHHAFLRSADGCADAEAPLAGPHPSDACRPPSALLALGQRDGPPYQPGSILIDTPLPLTELLYFSEPPTAEDGHEMAEPSPLHRKAPKGRNSNSPSSYRVCNGSQPQHVSIPHFCDVV